MRAAAHGGKWLCDQCGTRFYDLNKTGPSGGAVCPECGTELHRAPKLPSGTRAKSRKAPQPPRLSPARTPAKAGNAEAEGEDPEEDDLTGDDEDDILDVDNGDDNDEAEDSGPAA